MFYPYWSYQPKIRKRTVVMTEHGWTVKETGELLVSNLQIKERMAKYLGADSAEFTADKIILDMQGKSVDLNFDEIRAFIDSPTDFVPVSVASVTVLPTTFSIAVGATQQLVPTVLPANASNKSVTYVSSLPAVASVSPTGLVTALTGGTTTVTITTVDGNKTTTSVATITVPVASATLTPATASIVVGATQQLTGGVLPANATVKTVTYTSADPLVATVSNTGLVTAVKVGSSVVTVKSTDGNKTATSTITVTPVLVASVTLAPATASIAVGATQQLTPTVLPANAANKAVTYTSSVPAVASVSASGLVTALTEGSTVITVNTTDGNKKATSDITVTAA